MFTTKLKKAEIIDILVPATIKNWTVNSPEYNHKNKGPSIARMYRSWNKKDLLNYLNQLAEKGYVENA